MQFRDLIANIKTRIDIVDVVSQYVSLKNAGGRLKGLCPFHAEKTPSFFVMRERQRFHCYGCGTGGDAIDFIQKQESYTLAETLELLAEKAGVQFTPDNTDSQEYRKEQDIRKVLQAATEFYMEKLRTSQKAHDLLRDRGVTEKSIEAFRIGYAPEGWANLLDHLKSKGFPIEDIVLAGLASSGQSDKYFDVFRNRIIFPICSRNNKVIGFGGRAIGDAMPNMPKYVNSPETLVFKKSETLYGIHLSGDEIARKKFAIVAEGYLDVIMCWQNGFRNAVAPLGTALTDKHLQKLRPLTRNIALVFDGDDAGRAAAMKSLRSVCSSGFSAKITTLPGGEDPDSYIVKHGPAALKDQIVQSLGIVDYVFKSTEGSHVEKARAALEIVSGAPSRIELSDFISTIARLANLREDDLCVELKRYTQKRSAAAIGTPAMTDTNNAERMLLSAIIAFPCKVLEISNREEVSFLRDPAIVSMLEEILSSVKDSGADGFQIDNLARSFPEEHRRILSHICAEMPALSEEKADKMINACLSSVARTHADRQIADAIRSGDESALDELVEKKAKARRSAVHDLTAGQPDPF